MSCLHTISKAPSSGLLRRCLPLLGGRDGLLFIEDGVYHCIDPELIDRIASGVAVYGLRDDLLARGQMDRCVERVKTASRRRFVELCCDHDKVVNWF